MARLILLRHGLEESPERLHGWVDVPMLDKGVEQARRAAAYLADLHFKDAYTSDLTRTSETAKIVAEAQNGLVPKAAPALRSLNLGLLSDRPAKDVGDKLAALWAEWPNNDGLRAPEGESWAEFQGRVYPFMFRMQREAQDADVLAVTHSHVCSYAAGVAMNGGRPLYGRALELARRVDVQPGNALELVDGRITRLNFIR